MIKLFRKIRYNLMENNRTTKYLLYAIGEIILVVIGILIALQINDWNDEQKTKTLETKILKEIHSNLVLDLEEIRSDHKFMDSINKACSELKTYINKNDSPSEVVFDLFSVLRITPHFDPNTSGYGLLQSKGVEVISNDSLRNAISVLYERSYPYYRRYEEERLRFHALHSEPKLLEYFDMKFAQTSSSYGKFIITDTDFMKLKEDPSFYKLLSAIAFENSAVQDRATRTINAIEALMEFINLKLND